MHSGEKLLQNLVGRARDRLDGPPFRPLSSCTAVSFQPARVLSQKIAATTASRPSPVALRNRFSATLALALTWPLSSSSPCAMSWDRCLSRGRCRFQPRHSQPWSPPAGGRKDRGLWAGRAMSQSAPQISPGMRLRCATEAYWGAIFGSVRLWGILTAVAAGSPKQAPGGVFSCRYAYPPGMAIAGR
jgi:hypothetical protein